MSAAANACLPNPRRACSQRAMASERWLARGLVPDRKFWHLGINGAPAQWHD